MSTLVNGTPTASSAPEGAQDKPGFRTKTIATRITPEELREVEAAAEKSGKTLAVWLRELALSDLALGHYHRAPETGARSVCGRGSGGVPGGGADDRLRAVANSCRDRACHPAVLERACRVGPLQLQPHLRARTLGDSRCMHKRRRTLLKRYHRIVRPEGQAIAEALDDPGQETAR